MAPPVLRHVGQAGADRLRGGADADGPAAHPRIRRWSAGVRPKSIRASSVRPEPTRPARPTISPARTSRFTSADAARRGRPARGRARATSPVGTRALGEDGLEVAADHQPDQLVAGRGRPASRVATCAPSRRTVTRSAIAQDLVEAMRDVDDADPGARSSRHQGEQALRLRSARAAVGSSMMRTRACAPRARAISTSCCSAMRRRCRPRRRDRCRRRRAPSSAAARARRSPPVDAPPGAARLQAEGEVLRHREVGEQRRLLVDRGHAQAAGQQRIRARDADGPRWSTRARVRRDGRR